MRHGKVNYQDAGWLNRREFMGWVKGYTPPKLLDDQPIPAIRPETSKPAIFAALCAG
ncbi:hypothetical protein NKH09_24560 [Mesorhizobium sp. M1339]|uniref:hypothetical protein n=1 Tax=Mesorhizobium sp. M1339 TaxID=2957086 RepID=UPI0033386CC7